MEAQPSAVSPRPCIQITTLVYEPDEGMKVTPRSPMPSLRIAFIFASRLLEKNVRWDEPRDWAEFRCAWAAEQTKDEKESEKTTKVDQRFTD